MIQKASIPHVLSYAARLTEETDKALAISIYEQLIAYFESYNSEYAKLAKSRVAQLN